MRRLAGHDMLDPSLHMPLFQRGFRAKLHDKRALRREGGLLLEDWFDSCAPPTLLAFSCNRVGFMRGE